MPLLVRACELTDWNEKQAEQYMYVVSGNGELGDRKLFTLNSLELLGLAWMMMLFTSDFVNRTTNPSTMVPT